MQKDYRIVVEEVVTKAIWIEASTAEEAMEKAVQKYRAGEFILDGDSDVTFRQLCVDAPEDEQTEWTTF